VKLKDKLKAEYGWFAKKPEVVFLGEGLVNAGRIYGTLDNVPENKCIEMPICENLIVSCAIGLALKGFRPICVFQRHDFLLTAMDAIVNHLCMMGEISGHQFKLPVIVRAIVGSGSKKFDVGMQHRQDYRYMFTPYMNVEVIDKNWKGNLKKEYVIKNPLLITETKDDFEKEVK